MRLNGPSFLRDVGDESESTCDETFDELTAVTFAIRLAIPTRHEPDTTTFCALWINVAPETFSREGEPLNLSETAEVLSRITSLQREGRPMALATIVSVRGSTYRRPGARLLVPEDGSPIGNLSGGCLEGEVEEVARKVMAGDGARLELYDLTADDEVVWGWGLGCNGAIEVLVEPADRAAETAEALRLAIEEERLVGMATAIESDVPGVDVGARLMLDGEGNQTGSLGPATDLVSARLGDAMDAGETRLEDVIVAGGTVRAFLEVIEPPLRLVVCGAGHDAIPLVRLGADLGWKVTVVDDRESFLDAARFPGAADFVLAPPGEVAGAAGVDGRCYAVVMSHNYLRDRDYLRSLLTSDTAYIGMLGPGARLERLLEDLRGEGAVIPTDRLDKVHGPAGLDLGGEGPNEVAAAIVAEVLALSRDRAGGFLRDRGGPIHERRQPTAATG
jgi:xanthine dehydrogenase accessory factor